METSTYTILVVGVLAATFTDTQAAVAIGPAKINQDCPGQCWDADNNQCVPLHESFTTSSGCSRATCTSYKEKMFIEYQTCGSVAFPPVLPPGCQIVADKSLSYPACCTTMTCDNSVSLKNDPEYQEFTNWLEQEYPGDDSFEKNSIEKNSIEN